MAREGNIFKESFEKPPVLIKLEPNFGVNEHWGKKEVDQALLLTGVPEGLGELTDKEGLDKIAQLKIGVGQVFYDGFLIGKRKKERLRQTTKTAIESAVNKPLVVAYSAGVLNFEGMSDEEIEKIDQTVWVNPFLGREVILDKFRFAGKLFPKTSEVMEQLEPVIKKLVEANKLTVIISSDDNLLKSEVIKKLLLDKVGVGHLMERQGDHGISQKELIEIINNYG